MMVRLLPLVLLATVACKDGGDDGDERVDEVLSLTGDATAGAAAYTSQCVSCHAADGDGTGLASGIDLNETVPTSNDESTVLILLDGTSVMPAFGGTIQPQGLADVLAHLNSEFGG